MATKKGYITVATDDNETKITGHYSTFKEAQDALGEGEEVYEVSAVWSTKPKYDFTKQNLGNIFG